MERKFGRAFLLFVAVYGLLAGLFYWIVKDDWKETVVTTDAVDQISILPEMDGTTLISQTIIPESDQLRQLILAVSLLPEENPESRVEITLQAENGTQLAQWQVTAEDVNENNQLILSLNQPAGNIRGRELCLTLAGQGKLAFWYGDTINTGRFQVKKESRGQLTLNGRPISGELALRQVGVQVNNYMDYFWPVAAVLFLLLGSTALWAHHRRRTGRLCVLNRAMDLVRQYQFLLRTLVTRDFRVKYKSSILGMLWSFLNPLLMTFVYWFVFSTVFRSNIENFVVYVMSGIVLFNYFSDATNLGMQSVVGNAGLLTKVYMPKYILPMSKVLSAAINMIISLVPLLIIMAATGVPFHRSMLLLPLVLLFLIIFCMGLSLMLSACMVFFRDIQFLWGIMLTIWNFVTPLFYPESIIPARFITLYHMNPMYQYLYFLRTISLGGVTPMPVNYLYCICCSGVVLALGLFVFRRTQDKFILHL